MQKLKNIVNQSYKQYLGSNPYKGFVPFFGSHKLAHSMEFVYYPLNKILINENEFNFDNLEKILNDIFERKKTAIVRIFLDYPAKESGFPIIILNMLSQ